MRSNTTGVAPPGLCLSRAADAGVAPRGLGAVEGVRCRGGGRGRREKEICVAGSPRGKSFSGFLLVKVAAFECLEWTRGYSGFESLLR